MRVDLFSVIHKGLRSVLFEAALEAARVDPTSSPAVDALVARVERLLAYLEEHAHAEDTHIFPALRTIAPELAASLAADHRGLEVVQLETERAAHALALADLAGRAEAAAHLLRLLNHLTAVHLVHMNREETEASAALWAGMADGELAGLRVRIQASIPPDRHAEWLAILGPALSPQERRLVVGPPLG